MTLHRSTPSIPQVPTATLTYAETAIFGLIFNLNSSFSEFYFEIQFQNYNICKQDTH